MEIWHFTHVHLVVRLLEDLGGAGGPDVQKTWVNVLQCGVPARLLSWFISPISLGFMVDIPNYFMGVIKRQTSLGSTTLYKWQWEIKN